MTLHAYLTLAAILFSIGFFGVMTRRNTIGILLGIELMLNAVNINLVAFARFNARLNGVDNAEFREGDLFAPVAGERFDLVICNPPYVVSPETELLFRDGGRPGDSFCEEVVRGLGRHLAPSGFATTLVNWVVRDGEHWSQPLRGWVAGQDCDALLLHLETKDALEYAAGWNREPDSARYAAALDRWVAYYREHGIRSIGMGAVVLRRRASGTPWVSALELATRPAGNASTAILQAFAAQDRLAGLASREALFARMRQEGARIVSREMVAFEWLGEADTPLFREVNREFLRG